MTKYFHPSLVVAQELLDRKAKDYEGTRDEDADPARSSYFPYGNISYLHMVHLKLKRIETLVLKKHNNPDQPINFESLEDSLIDLINYCAFFHSHLTKEDSNEH